MISSTLTVEEKAKELIEKFHYQICNDNGISENDSSEFCAKQCALICVDQILESIAGKPDNWSINVYWMNARFYNSNECKEYWQSVRTAIENH